MDNFSPLIQKFRELGFLQDLKDDSHINIVRLCIARAEEHRQSIFNKDHNSSQNNNNFSIISNGRIQENCAMGAISINELPLGPLKYLKVNNNKRLEDFLKNKVRIVLLWLLLFHYILSNFYSF